MQSLAALSDDAPPPDSPGRGGTREERPLLWSGPAHVRLRCDERRLAAPRLGQAAARRRCGQRVRRRAARVRRANLLADRLETRARPRLPGPSMHFCRGRVHGDARLRGVPGYGPVPCTLRERDRRGSPGLRAGGRAVLRYQRGVPRKNKSDALGPRVAMDRRVSGVLRVSIWLWAAVRARSSLPRRARALRRCAAEDDEPTCRPGADGPAVPLPPADVAGAQLRAEGVVSRAAGSNVGRPRARRRAADLARRRLRRGNAGGSAGPTAAPVRPIPRRDYMAARELVARDAQSRCVRRVRPEAAPSGTGAPCPYS